MQSTEIKLEGLAAGEVLACPYAGSRYDSTPRDLLPKLSLATVERVTPKRAVLHPHEYGQPVTIELATGREISSRYFAPFWRRCTPEEIAETNAALERCKRWKVLAGWLLDFKPAKLPSLATLEAMRAAFDAAGEEVR